MSPTLPRLILASSSPRRRELLRQAGYAFDVAPPADDRESPPRAGEPAAEYVQRLARDKALQVAPQAPDRLVLACDTVAERAGEFLSKPADRQDAARMLGLLSGREHTVYSGVCLHLSPHGPTRTTVAATRLRMDSLSAEQIAAYLASGRWQGKAGAFGYQDGPDWLHLVEGSESNVVGLPLELLARMLEEFEESA